MGKWLPPPNPSTRRAPATTIPSKNYSLMSLFPPAHFKSNARWPPLVPKITHNNQHTPTRYNVYAPSPPHSFSPRRLSLTLNILQRQRPHATGKIAIFHLFATRPQHGASSPVFFFASFGKNFKHSNFLQQSPRRTSNTNHRGKQCFFSYSFREREDKDLLNNYLVFIRFNCE